jgi:uncharacterized protein YxjI
MTLFYLTNILVGYLAGHLLLRLLSFGISFGTSIVSAHHCTQLLIRFVQWLFQRFDIFGAGDRAVGSLQQRFAWLNKRFDLLDTRGRVIMTMTSPIWQIWTFTVSKGDRKIAVIEKKWSGLMKEMFTDADNFRVMFIDAKLTTDEKLLLLTSAVFIDLSYFERKAS